jgi:hypothetical protein
VGDSIAKTIAAMVQRTVNAAVVENVGRIAGMVTLHCDSADQVR